MKIKIFFLCILLGYLTKKFSQKFDLNVDNFSTSTLIAGVLIGGSLIGTELKTLLGAGWGVPLCSVFSAVCAVLNLPLNTANKSSYFTVQISANVVRKIYASAIAVKGVVFRNNRFSKLTGGSYLLFNDPNIIDNWNTHNSIPQLFPGFYKPFSQYVTG